MYKLQIITLCIYMLFTCLSASAQNKKASRDKYDKTDIIVSADVLEVEIKQFVKIPSFYSNLTRLKRAILLTYPIARKAEIKLNEMRDSIPKIENSNNRRKYIKSVEDELVAQYTPILKRMSFYQGVILLKLIDRQTGKNGYNLLRELKSGLSATFWLIISKFYGVNLKLEYQPLERDWAMERYVQMYEKELGLTPHQNTKDEPEQPNIGE